MIQPKIKATNIELTDSLRTKIESELQHIDKFLSNDAEALCEVEIEKTTTNDGATYRAEFNLTDSGKFYRAESRTGDMYQALDETRSEIVSEVKRARNKRRDLIRRGGGKVKNMLKRLSF